MNIQSFRDFCLAFKGVTESLPFDENILVFKVQGKIFTLTDLENFDSFNVKCDPEIAVKLREEYPNTVKEGYHMSKKHWNTIFTHNKDLKDEDLKKWITHSYELVKQGLSKKLREELENL